MANRISTFVEFATDSAKSSLGSLKTSIADADGVGGKFKAGFSSLKDSVSENAGALSIAAGGALVAFGLKAVGAFTESAKAALDMGSATGLAVEDASRWIAVGDDMGVSADSLTTAFGRVGKTLDDSKWEKYGIATRDAGGEARSVNDILLDSVDKLGKITNETERAKAGNALFGKGYKSLSPLIGKTREEMEGYLGSVEKGQVITKAEAEKAEKFRLAEDKLSDAFKEVTLSVGGLVAGLAPLIDKLATAVGLLTDNSAISEDAADDFAALGDAMNEIKPPNQDIEYWLKLQYESKLSLEQTIEAMKNSKLPAEELAQKLRDQAAATSETDRETRKLSGTMGDNKDETEALALSVEHAKKAEKDLNDAVISGIQAQRDMNTAREDALDSVGDLEQSLRDLDTAYYELQQQQLENIKTQDDSTLKQGEKDQSNRDLATSEHDLGQQVKDAAKEYADQSGAVDGTKHHTDLLVDSLLWSKAQYPLLADEIQKYIDKLLNIPTDVNTRIHHSATDYGVAASGGTRSGMTLVGEKGPELVDLPNGSFVHTAAETASMAGASGGGDTYHNTIIVQNMPTPNELVALLAKYTQRNGPAALRAIS